MPVRLVVTTYARPGQGAALAQAMADRCHSSGSGRLDRPYPGRLLLCGELWHTFLLSSGSEPG